MIFRAESTNLRGYMGEINLPERQIEVYTKPADGGYAQINVFRKGDQIKTAAVDTLDVDEILL